MPLHEWTDRPGWDGMHLLWITELLRWVRPRLPSGYRAFVGTAPLLAVGGSDGRPDVHVHQWSGSAGREAEQPPEFRTLTGVEFEPDIELAVATLDPGHALFVERQDRLVAAVELISPRNKDRPAARDADVARYLGYLLESVHLLLVDVHRRPAGFSFPDRIAAELSLNQPPLASPAAVAYRVGEPAATGGRYLAIWRRPLEAGASLPTLPLPLDVDLRIPVDLERTYSAAAADAYVE